MGTLDLNVDLSEEERTFILAVLSRNEALMKKEEARVKKLKSEVHDIRMKSVIKAGQDTTSQCARCFSQLGWIFNRGEPCPQCKHRICPNCRIPLIDQTYSWLCKLCFKQMELQGQSGDWFYSEVKKKNIPAGAELVKQSIKGPHMNGHAGKSVGDEVKRVLTNNNASPAHKRTTSRHSRSSGGETSDDGSANIHKVGFPKDSDQRRLMDLVRSISNKSDSDSGSGHVTVKRVTSRHYGDTDSDSSSSSESDHEAQRSPLPRRGRESEPSSMPASRTDSVRSSIRSSSAVSSEQSTALVESTVMLDTQSAPNSPHLDSTDGPVAPHNNNKQPVEQCNSIPDIQITTDATTIPPKDHAELDEMKDTFNEEENIDDLFASHKGSHGNLLSTMATSQESIASIYSEAGEGNYGNIAISGDILFGLDYNYKSSILEINIKQCRDLAIVDTKRNRSDPYVKIYLLPDKTKNGKRKTKVKKHTVNPTFDEVIRYGITKSELETRTLWITVWNNDTFGRNDFLGELTIPLDYYHFDDATPRWYPLQDRPKATDDVDGGAHPLTLLTYKGDLILSMRYVTPDKISRENSPTKTKKKHSKPKSSGKGQLEVMVSEARNLTAVRANGSSDPFCKGYLLPDRSKGAKQKTSVIKRDCNPKWNHTFIFEDVSVEDLADRGLELTIWDHDILSSNDFLGGNRLNLGTGRSNGREVDWMDARGDEITIWQSMLDRPNTWIDGGLMLRPNMDRRL